MFQNSAHDSICGCSADEVSAQVLVRYAEAEQIGRELARRAVERIAAKVPEDAYAVVNPSPLERTEVVELDGELRRPPCRRSAGPPSNRDESQGQSLRFRSRRGSCAARTSGTATTTRRRTTT